MRDEVRVCMGVIEGANEGGACIEMVIGSSI